LLTLGVMWPTRWLDARDNRRRVRRPADGNPGASPVVPSVTQPNVITSAHLRRNPPMARDLYLRKDRRPGRTIMLKSIVACVALAAAVTLTNVTPAGAFMPLQSGLITAADAVSDVVEVKRSKLKPRPPGWSHGKKKGWGRSSVPPGQR
jgi:hypothetical protein